MRVLPLNLFITCCSLFLIRDHVLASRVTRDFPSRSRLRGGGKQEGEGCFLLSKEYHSSRLEQKWLDNAHKWSENFCLHMNAFSKEAQHWLDSIADLERGKGSDPVDSAVFSSFISTYDCNGQRVRKTTWIERLSHGLRHPRALCNGGADLVDRDYLLLAYNKDLLSPEPKRHELHGECAERSCQNIYVDLGASTWNTGAGGPSQSWFYKTYRRH